MRRAEGGPTTGHIIRHTVRARLSALRPGEREDETLSRVKETFAVVRKLRSVGGAAGPIPFHAFRRACAFYSLSLPFAAWWSPEESKDMGVRARLLRTHPGLGPSISA